MAVYKVGIDTKKNIYDACEQLFYEKGYTDTRINDILTVSGAKKSSFYHHFPEGKAEIARIILYDWMDHNHNASLLIEGETDELMYYCIELRILWDRIFYDEHLRKFISELTANKIPYDKVDVMRVFQLCKENSEHDLGKAGYLLISTVMLGVNDKLFYLAEKNTDEFTGEGLADFYIRTLFDMFFISPETIWYLIERSRELFQKLVIHNDKFHVSAVLAQ